MSLSVVTLIKQLESKASNTALPAEQRLADTCLWWFRNKDRISKENLPARLELQEKMFSIFLELNALIMERIQEIEGLKRSERLWLPRGVSVAGNLRRYG